QERRCDDDHHPQRSAWDRQVDACGSSHGEHRVLRHARRRPAPRRRSARRGAVNPPRANELEYLHSIIALLVAHHQRFGYRHVVIDYVWRSPKELDALRTRLVAIDPNADIRCFLLTLPAEENLRRIEQRQRARAIDERDFELRTFTEEREMLAGRSDLGEPFDVSASPSELVARMLRRLA